MTSTEEAVMSRVMKLLALANDDGATKAERALAGEQAERIMAKHTIDRFEANQRLKNGDTEARKPIQDSWTLVGTDNAEFDSQIIDMMEYVVTHCNVRVNRSYTFNNSSEKVFRLVGFREDIAYAERIWFNVFKTFLANLAPSWSLDKSIEWNAYTFASAGVSWKDQVLLAEKAGDHRIEWPWRYQDEDTSNEVTYTHNHYRIGKAIDPGNTPWGKSIHKLKRACKKYSVDNEVDYPYAPGAKLRVSSRNSFARSYRATIKSRLDELRRAANKDRDINADKFAVAIRDTKERVDEEFYRLFPEYDPEVQRRKQQKREAENLARWEALTPQEQKRLRAEQAARDAAWERQWRREAERERKKYGSYRENPAERIDNAAWARGRQVAQSVNLRADEEVKKTTNKEIS